MNPDVKTCLSLYSALQLSDTPEIESVFVIGGAQLYRKALQSPNCTQILYTSIEGDIEECDTFFPGIPSEFALDPCLSQAAPQEDGKLRYFFLVYNRIAAPQPHEEEQYLDLVREIIDHGNDKGDRTGVGTFSVFGRRMTFNLRDGRLPLLTTKRVFWRGVLEELLWFISGSTNSNILSEKGIHIWDGNSSRGYLDKNGLSHREEGDLGPVYGFQWRHWGASYTDFHADYSGQGIDQLQQCIEKIKNKPTDRRILMTAWNPSELNKMALPPCHMFCQFYVANGELSCQMYQRSCDIGLGVPFNIASYAALTHIMAHVCGLKAGDFVHVLGDTHIYKNHVDALREQLRVAPRPFPTLRILAAHQNIDELTSADFQLENYKPHKGLKMKMAV